MESTGTRAVKKQFRPDGGISDLGADRVAADPAQTYWPRLEGLGPWFLRNANSQDTYELLNK
jgi:hypothetical protein